MLKNMLTNMFVMRTVRGEVPALLRTNVAIRRAMSCFDNAAAMVNPPSSSIITGVHIAANTICVASLGFSRVWGFSSDRIMRRTTTRKGISKEVTKSGITWEYPT